MTGSIYLKTLRDLRGQTAAWCLGLAMLGAVNVLVFPSVQKMPDLITFLDNLPSAFKAMIGDVRTMVQLEGFLRLKLFDPLPLLLAVFAVSRGAELIAGEVELKSADLLLARPIPRRRVVLEKFAALVTTTVFMAIATLVSVKVSAMVIGANLGLAYLAATIANSLPITWLFAAVALAGSCAFLKTRSAALLGGSVVIVSYVFETLRVIVPSLQRWSSLSLFSYQKAGVTLAGEIHPEPIAVLLGLVLTLLITAILVFERRDLVA